jgi:hypothetical protein
MGLGCIRSNKLEDALKYFEESARLGGAKFPKAKKTLELTKKIIQSEKRKKFNEDNPDEDIEFEDFDDLSTPKAS